MTRQIDQEISELLKQLIEIPSVSGSEDEILRFGANWLEKHGFDDIITHPMFMAGVVKASGKPAEKALILCGHIDTVAPGDEQRWTRSPWEPSEKDGRIYGLGSGDMKAGVALNMIAAAKYAEQPREDVDLWCVLVANEEVDGAGSAAFAEVFAKQTVYQQAACLISEPTDGARIEIGHRGNRFVTLTFTGESGHASQEASYDSSALPGVVNFLNNLQSIRQILHQKFRDPQLNHPTLTPTRISAEASHSSNKTAAASYLSIDIRTTPQLDARFDDWLNALAQEYNFSWKYDAEPVSSALCDPDAPILRSLKKLAPHLDVTVSTGATDQAFFQNIGVQTVVFGPGDFHLAHTIDESVSIEKIEQASEIVDELAGVVFRAD